VKSNEICCIVNQKERSSEITESIAIPKVREFNIDFLLTNCYTDWKDWKLIWIYQLCRLKKQH
jgi:hypothetical protein